MSLRTVIMRTTNKKNILNLFSKQGLKEQAKMMRFTRTLKIL